MLTARFLARGAAALAGALARARPAPAAAAAPVAARPDGRRADRPPQGVRPRFRLLERGGRAEWLLNYRERRVPAARGCGDDARRGAQRHHDRAARRRAGGPDPGRARRAATWTRCRWRRRPRWRSTRRPTPPPWDDAVTMALNYAGIKFEKVWDAEVLGAKLKTYDWLHLHHEDFTGQYSKFFLNYAGAPWLVDMVERNRAMARQLGFPRCRPRSARSRVAIADYVERGGFLFAMCTATETLDLALAADRRGHRGRLRRRHADGPGRVAPDAVGAGARLPERAAGAEPDRAGVLRHRRPPGEFARAPAAAGLVHAVQFQRQDRSGGHDAGAEPPAGHPRFLRPHHVVHPARPSSRA